MSNELRSVLPSNPGIEDPPAGVGSRKLLLRGNEVPLQGSGLQAAKDPLKVKACGQRSSGRPISPRDLPRRWPIQSTTAPSSYARQPGHEHWCPQPRQAVHHVGTAGPSISAKWQNSVKRMHIQLVSSVRGLTMIAWPRNAELDAHRTLQPPDADSPTRSTATCTQTGLL
mgnify:CR=1 FL=1